MSNLWITDKVVLGYVIGLVLAYAFLYFLFLRKRFVAQKQYRGLKKKYNMDCAFCYHITISPFNISGDCYVLADRKDLRIINCAGTPIDICIPYEDILSFSVNSNIHAGIKLKYYKTDHEFDIYLKGSKTPSHIGYFYGGRDALYNFNKYATRKCDFHKFIAQYMQPKTVTYTK